MEVKYLRLIKAIVDEGSIINASKKLFLTPSALSHQLKEAEESIDAKIFDRINKKLVLTEVGRKLYDGADVILDHLTKMDQDIKEMVKGTFGKIVISTECYTNYSWLPPIIKQFKEIYPNVEIQINFKDTHKALSKLIDGELDLAITSDPNDKQNIEFIELFDDQMFAIAAISHKWSNEKYLTAKDFKDETLIIHSEPLDTVTVYSNVLKPEGVTPKNILPIPLTEASLEMVKAEMGVTVMPNWAYNPYHDPDKMIKKSIGPNGLHRKHFIARLKNRSFPEYYNDFIAFVKKELILKSEE